MSNISNDHVKKVCQPGTASCCTYLTMRDGWTCAKAIGLEGIKALLDQRRAEKTIRAMGDNCSGPPNFSAQTDEPMMNGGK